MANLFSRIKNSIEADFHDILDKKEQKNPIVLLNQYLRECEHETEKVRKLLERQYLLNGEFTKEFNQAKSLADKRKRQAEIASQAGETELYNFAQQEHSHYEARAERLEELRNEAVKQLDELERKYEEMKHKLKDMHIRRMELMGKENVSRANHRMDKILQTNDETNSAYSRFEEMETYLDRLEHQVNTNYHRSTIDAKIANLEQEMNKAESHS
ncbi:PspA/IM30 family protein [Metabacillus arenae]|uniref:PspA/IM30 family protein n=1 Tax=Metabacillus arenae TaxID=2771434 RepID=A0A926N8S0_9BACI|nr:PspA/IM30 family protein [Metabacillus arenae]MBD1379567.1 PspA/IM30 family protein [Metabacillus arenae]